MPLLRSTFRPPFVVRSYFPVELFLVVAEQLLRDSKEAWRAIVAIVHLRSASKTTLRLISGSLEIRERFLDAVLNVRNARPAVRFVRWACLCVWRDLLRDSAMIRRVTMLIFAFKNPMIKALVAMGYDLNSRSEAYGNTALIEAVYFTKIRLAMQLVDAGASALIQDYLGRDAYDYARIRCDELVEAGFDEQSQHTLRDALIELLDPHNADIRAVVKALRSRYI